MWVHSSCDIFVVVSCRGTLNSLIFMKVWSMPAWIPFVSSSLYFWKSVFSFRVHSGCLYTRLLRKTQEDDKKVIKSGGNRARFDFTMLINTSVLDPLSKTARSPKLDKNERFFRWCMWYRTEFDFIVLFIHLHTRKIPFNAPVFILRSKDPW